MIAAEAVGKLLHRIAIHDYSMVMTYQDGREEHSCIYCGRKKQ